MESLVLAVVHLYPEEILAFDFRGVAFLLGLFTLHLRVIGWLVFVGQRVKACL